MAHNKTDKGQQIDGEGAISKKMRIERRLSSIQKLGKTFGPTNSHHVKHDLPLIGMETIALIPVQTIQAQSQAKQGNHPQKQRSPANNYFHRYFLSTIFNR